MSNSTHAGLKKHSVSTSTVVFMIFCLCAAGAYGIEESRVVLTEALQIENLDFGELQASVDSISQALGSHLAALASYKE